MAGNEWINGYLEAILSTGGGASTTVEEQQRVAAAARESGDHFNPTKYFVEEVVSAVDESDLHRTWLKVVATRNTRERSSRLENMCWRIWHLARKKKQVFIIQLYSINVNFHSSTYMIC
jgi:sucrose-phosphate synthase